ncbi:hypothetical protein [Streptomyces sp. NPDC007264]|uniref:hypothetical protein n=1 Tax=Streptomyces sp. NPDC007264 TaxID=3364777 RepID=UPI0036DBE1A0
MSGDGKQPDLHKAEHQEAVRQNGTLDTVMGMTGVINPWGPKQGFHFGRTSFEDYDLNEMIDIVESANPELLENAGTALVDARDAISKAADELSTNLGGVDWEGEARTAFSTWGNDLVTTALALADYADVVGTQVMAASSGLASVRKSMPPRDTRSAPRTVDDIPEAKRVDTNDEYTAAVKAESHRQEAINQMYRLASYYTVSSGTIQAAEEPVFPKMPDVGVPEPKGDRGVEPPPPGEAHLPSGTRTSEGVRHRSVSTSAERPQPNAPSPSTTGVDDSVPSPDRHVGTKVDSVGTSPPQETLKPGFVTPPSTTGPNVAPVGTVPPFAPVAVPPAVRGPVGRTSGFGGTAGTKAPASAQGRVSTPPGRAAAGRTRTGPTGQMGRTSVPGQADDRVAGPGGRGVVGGTPRAGATAAGHAGGAPRGSVTGTGATNPRRAGIPRTTDGVVGGKPVTGDGSGAKGPRVPRGTVIGGEHVPASPVTGERPGQRGVIGAPGSTTGKGQTSRRPVSGSASVVGTPKDRPGARDGGRTPGGADVTPGRVGARDRVAARSRHDERRDETSATD